MRQDESGNHMCFEAPSDSTVSCKVQGATGSTNGNVIDNTGLTTRKCHSNCRFLRGFNSTAAALQYMYGSSINGIKFDVKLPRYFV